jgi:hypothetical protein
MSSMNDTPTSSYSSPPSPYTSEALPTYQSHELGIASAQGPGSFADLQRHAFPLGSDSENTVGPRYCEFKRLNILVTLKKLLS